MHEVHVEKFSLLTPPNNDPASAWQESARQMECFQGSRVRISPLLSFHLFPPNSRMCCMQLKFNRQTPSSGSSMLLWWGVDPEGGIVVYVLSEQSYHNMQDICSLHQPGLVSVQVSGLKLSLLFPVSVSILFFSRSICVSLFLYRTVQENQFLNMKLRSFKKESRISTSQTIML